MNILSKIVIPLFVVFVVFYGFTKKVNIYDAFLDGAKAYKYLLIFFLILLLWFLLLIFF